MLLSTIGSVAIRKHRQTDIILDSFTIYYVKPVQLDDQLTVSAKVIEEGRSSNKIEITCCHDKEIVAKALMSARSMR